MRSRTTLILCSLMALSVIVMRILDWKDLREFQEASLIGSSITPRGAGRALALALAIEESHGVCRRAYALLWPGPTEIRSRVLSRTLDGLSATRKSPLNGPQFLEGLEAAAAVAAGELGEPLNLDLAVPLSIQRAYPRLWEEGRSQSVAPDPTEGWLSTVLLCRTGEPSRCAEAKRPALLYLYRITTAKLAAWILAATSLLLIARLKNAREGVLGAQPRDSIVAWLQGLSILVVGDGLAERLYVYFGAGYYWWMAVRALVFGTAIKVSLSRLRSEGLVNWKLERSAIAWTATALGLSVLSDEVASLAGDGLPALMYHNGSEALLIGDVLVLGVFSVFLSPIVEELLFRGLLFSGLRAAAGGAVAIVASAMAFAAFHVGTGERLLSAFCVGIGMGLVRHRSGTIAPCIAAHCLNNFWWWSHDWWIMVAGG